MLDVQVKPVTPIQVLCMEKEAIPALLAIASHISKWLEPLLCCAELLVCF